MIIEPEYRERDLIDSIPTINEEDSLLSKLIGREKRITINNDQGAKEILIKTMLPHPSADYHTLYHLTGESFRAQVEICHWPKFSFYNKAWNALETFVQKSELQKLPLYQEALDHFVQKNNLLAPLDLQLNPYNRDKRSSSKTLLGLEFEENGSFVGAVNIIGSHTTVHDLSGWLGIEKEEEPALDLNINLQPTLQLFSFPMIVSELKSYDEGDIMIAPTMTHENCIHGKLFFNNRTYNTSINITHSTMEIKDIDTTNTTEAAFSNNAHLEDNDEIGELGNRLEQPQNLNQRNQSALDTDSLSVPISLEISELDINIRELESLSPGQIINLNHVEIPIITLKCNQQKIGQGRLVKFKDYIGVELSNIHCP